MILTGQPANVNILSAAYLKHFKLIDFSHGLLIHQFCTERSIAEINRLKRRLLAVGASTI